MAVIPSKRDLNPSKQGVHLAWNLTMFAPSKVGMSKRHPIAIALILIRTHKLFFHQLKSLIVN